MGYCIYMENSKLKIKEENILNCLEALKQYIQKPDYNIGYIGEKEIKIENKPDKIISLFNKFRYDIDYDEINKEYLFVNFIGEKDCNEDIFFKIISPYLEDGYISFRGEDGCLYRYVIKNHTLSIQNGIIKWK